MCLDEAEHDKIVRSSVDAENGVSASVEARYFVSNAAVETTTRDKVDSEICPFVCPLDALAVEFQNAEVVSFFSKVHVASFFGIKTDVPSNAILVASI